MRRRRLWIALAVLIVAAIIAGIVFLRKRSAPEAARLLPDADAVLYVNFKLMRLAHVFGEAPPVAYDPEYEQFVKETGFQFERDLDQAAFALHAGAVPGSGDVLERARYSDIFIGRFNLDRASAYFRKLATASEQYRDALIYSIPHEGRTVRVAILGVDTVAVSNTPNAAAMHDMVDKYRAAAWPASAPLLVRENYHHVPLASVVWALAKVPGKEAQSQPVLLPGGVEMPLQWLAGSTIIGSARYVGAIHLRIEALTQSPEHARQLMDTLNTFLVLLKTVDASTAHGGADPDVKSVFESLKVEEHGNRVALTASIPQGFIKKALSPPPPAPAQPQAAAPQKPPRKQKKK